MNWRESKGPTKWPWTWRANVVGGYTPGVYLIVADQRAVALRRRQALPDAYGGHALSWQSRPVRRPRLEAAARDRLRTLGQQGKSGGTDVLSGYGSARVDGLSGRRGAFGDDAAPRRRHGPARAGDDAARAGAGLDAARAGSRAAVGGIGPRSGPGGRRACAGLGRAARPVRLGRRGAQETVPSPSPAATTRSYRSTRRSSTPSSWSDRSK